MYHANVNVSLMEENVIQINDNRCRCECKKRHVSEKDYIWIRAKCTCKNRKYLASIMDDSTITCDEIIDAKAKSYDEKTKTVPTNFNEKNKVDCKAQNFYVLLTFLLISITLLIAASIYCYLIKYRAKQKHLLLFHDTNNELKEIIY